MCRIFGVHTLLLSAYYHLTALNDFHFRMELALPLYQQAYEVVSNVSEITLGKFMHAVINSITVFMFVLLRCSTIQQTIGSIQILLRNWLWFIVSW